MRAGARRLALLAALVAATAACGGSDEGTGSVPVDTGGVDTGATTTTSGPGPSAGLRVTVRKGTPLRLGREGNRVETLQRALGALGYQVGEPDGIFGEQTRRAVVAFQRNNGLPTDGIVGRKTAEAINRELGTG